MENLLKQIKDKQKMRTNSQLNMKQNNKNEDLVVLINSLNTDIKDFYQAIKKCLYQGKQNKNNIISSKEILDLIEQYLNDFIDKAKDKFKKMKYIRKINIIQQDINENKVGSNLLDSDFGSNKMKLSSDNIFLDKEFNNTINVNNKLLNKKQIFDETIYTSTKYNNNNNSNSMKINNFIDRNIICYDNLNNNNINEYTHHGTNYNIRKNSKFYNNNFNSSSESKNMIQSYNQFNDKNKKTKSVHDLRKKILINKNEFNTISNKDPNYYSANHTQINIISSKREILNNLNGIISLLKELKLVNRNIFNKSWEAEKHQKLLNKIYYELNNLISNIFKDNNL